MQLGGVVDGDNEGWDGREARFECRGRRESSAGQSFNDAGFVGGGGRVKWG